MAAKPENPNRLKATIFNALSDPVRIEIMDFLRDGEKCVCEIVPHLNLIQPVISRHLRILKDSGLVRCRKEGNKRMYSFTDQKIYQVVDALSPALADTVRREILEHMACG